MPTELNREDALRLIGAQTEALVRHLDQRCVAIAGFHGDEPDDLGSGTCITIEGRFFIATAAHVIEGFTNDDLFIIHTRTPSDARMPILRRGARGGHGAPEDVAFLELSANNAEKLGKVFVEAERLRPQISDLPQDVVLVYGYPGEKIDRVALREKKLHIQSIGYTSLTIPLASVRNFRFPPSAAHDLFFEYPREDNILSNGETLLKLPEAPGISGGGVWMTCLNDAGVWDPSKCKMIGIERTWLEYEWCRCTQIQHWLDLLRTEIPELQSAVDHILTS